MTAKEILDNNSEGAGDYMEKKLDKAVPNGRKLSEAAKAAMAKRELAGNVTGSELN